MKQRLTFRLLIVSLLVALLTGCKSDSSPTLLDSPTRSGSASEAWFQHPFPASGEALSIAVGEEHAIALSPGRGISLIHGGIESEVEGIWLEMTLESVGMPAQVTEQQVEVPSEGGRLELRQDHAGFAWLRLRAKGDGDGAVTIRSPKLERLSDINRLPWCDQSQVQTVDQPNLFIFMVDTLRADHLPVYGYSRPTTPTLDRFAQSAIVFDNVAAQAPWTRPSVASMFTGMTPFGHGVTDRDDALPLAAQTLAEQLRTAGYETAAIITNGMVSDRYGFDQGFDSFVRPRIPKSDDDTDRETDNTSADSRRPKSGILALSRVEDFLESRVHDRPLFLYLHLNEPHAPYTAPEPFLAQWAPQVDGSIGSLDRLRALRTADDIDESYKNDVKALYDAEIAFTDHLFERFLAALIEHRLFDNSAILFVADHGEQFWESRIWGHGLTLTQSLLHVPFILKTPGQTCGFRTARHAQHIDIKPTFLFYAGVDNEQPGEGEVLVRDVAPIDRLAYSALDKERCTGVAITSQDWKLVESRSKNFTRFNQELFLHDRSSNDEESIDLQDQYPEVVEYLRQRIRDYESAEEVLSSSVTPLDESLRQELEALGYLEPDSTPGPSS